MKSWRKQKVMRWLFLLSDVIYNLATEIEQGLKEDEK